MDLIYLAIIVITIYFIFQLIVLPKIRYNNLNKVLMEIVVQNNFELIKSRSKLYHFLIKTPTKNLYINFISVPKNSIVTINSLRTWRLSWGGSPAKPGRNYPNSRYLSELTNFLTCKVNDEQAQKVILIYKKTEKVLMYINESELEIVTSKNRPHGIKVIQYHSLKNDFKDLLN